jgi:LysR family hca operon transcriptional activator
MIASTGGGRPASAICAKPAAKTVVSRPIQGAPPMVDLVIGYNETNTSPLLKFLLTKVDELKFRVAKNDGR